MGKEIERKFLVDPVKWVDIEKGEGKFIVQGYLLNEPDRSIRVRIKDTDAFITIKLGGSDLSRNEFEYTIPLADARSLLERIEKWIEKTRYKILFHGKTWEVDVFHGINEGLLMAEIEISTEGEQFDTPEWAIKEVTGDSRYYNANLVERRV